MTRRRAAEPGWMRRLARPTTLTSPTFMEPAWGPWVLISEIYWMSYKLLERRLFHVGISAAQARIIAILYYAREPIRPSLVALVLFQETQSITGILHRLESRGWVRRRRDRTDRRAVGINLTAAGRRVASEVVRISEELYEELFSSAMNRAEGREVVKALRKVRANGFKLPETDFKLRRAREFPLWSD